LKNLALSNNDFLSYKVHIELNVFYAFVVHWIRAHVAGGDIVAEDDCGLGQWAVKLAQELSEPGALSHSVGNAVVFSFCA
jgi:hypothetical protein